MSKIQRVGLALAVVAILILGVMSNVRAQRSTATGLQWDAVNSLFHLMANGADYPVQKHLLENCTTVVACTATVVPSGFTVFGTAPYTTGSPSTITLTGLPFTSTTSYVCTASEVTDASKTAFKIVNASASSTVITGPNTITDTMNYICVGT